MGDLVRTGVSLERDLLTKFDVVIEEKGYQNRSEAIRDLIRRHLVAEDIDKNKVVVGTLTIIYDHHESDGKTCGRTAPSRRCHTRSYPRPLGSSLLS